VRQAVSPARRFLYIFLHLQLTQRSGRALLGQLNFDYAHVPAGQQASDLNFQTGMNATRKVQIGVRVDF